MGGQTTCLSVFICMAPLKKFDSIFRAVRASEMTGMAKVKMKNRNVTGMVFALLLMPEGGDMSLRDVALVSTISLREVGNQAGLNLSEVADFWT